MDFYSKFAMYYSLGVSHGQCTSIRPTKRKKSKSELRFFPKYTKKIVSKDKIEKSNHSSQCSVEET